MSNNLISECGEDVKVEEVTVCDKEYKEKMEKLYAQQANSLVRENRAMLADGRVIDTGDVEATAEIPQWLKNRKKVDELVKHGDGKVVHAKNIIQQAFAESEQTIEEQVAAVNNGRGVN